ncbi:MAG: VIT1/CCC1 transporter family protein, partial [Patescibacteria group bacterium]
SPWVIIVLGMANLIADGISMGLSNYLAIHSKLDYQNGERAREELEIEKFPLIEKKEVLDILTGWGIKEPELGKVLDNITADKKTWVNFMMREELGIMEDDVKTPITHGLVTMGAFVVAGFLPLVPYVFGVPIESQFTISIIATVVSLFMVGSLRTLVTGGSWFKSGLQMLLVGGLAATSAYLVGGIVKSFFGITI